MQNLLFDNKSDDTTDQSMNEEENDEEGEHDTDAWEEGVDLTR